jgi:hypothetical protein
MRLTCKLPEGWSHSVYIKCPTLCSFVWVRALSMVKVQKYSSQLPHTFSDPFSVWKPVLGPACWSLYVWHANICRLWKSISYHINVKVDQILTTPTHLDWKRIQELPNSGIHYLCPISLPCFNASLELCWAHCKLGATTYKNLKFLAAQKKAAPKVLIFLLFLPGVSSPL